MSFKTNLKKFGETHYSKDKAYLNAIITSDSSYVPPKKRWAESFKPLMWIYVALVFIVTSVSLATLAVDTPTQKKYASLFTIIEAVVFIVLVIDLILRWYTSEVRIKKGNWSYFLFPATVTGILLIASLLPSLYIVNVWSGSNIQIFKVFEHMKFLRIFRIILLANLVPGLSLFRRVMAKEKSTLYTVFGLVLIAIVLFSLVIFNVEQGQKGADGSIKINNFFDALYFSTVTLTTIGFGDISPVTETGRVVVMVMAVMGVAILAIPSGVIAGGFISELKLVRKQKEELKASKEKKKSKK